MEIVKEKGEEERIVLRFIQLSDLHITDHKDLLEPMVDSINRESVDFVVVTGDLVHEPKKELFDVALNSINKIRHRVIATPGDYDYGELWTEYFGDRYKGTEINGFHLDFLDTSFVRHRFAIGWADVMMEEDPEQYMWLKDRLAKDNKYHIIFSHHPFWVRGEKDKHELLADNVRAIYSGHLHEASKFYWKYDKPKRAFGNGFAAVSMQFHGNSCYLLVLMKATDEVINYPKAIGLKRTAW